MSDIVSEQDLSWIGKVPDSWKLLRLGSIFKCRNVKVDDKNYPPLSVSKEGIVPQLESVAKTDANDNRKEVLTGDFVINSRSDRKQSCGLASQNGSVSLINTVLFQKKPILFPDFAGYLLNNYGFAEEFYRWGHGIVADLWTTRWQEMSSIILPIPPLDIQKKISFFLDKSCSGIAKAIDNEKEEIEKLNEYYQSVLEETITRGLSITAERKDSGITGAGEIPTSWKVVPLSSVLTSIRNGYVGPTKDILFDEGTRYIQSLHIKNGKIDFDKCPYFVKKEWGEQHPKVHTGDLLIVQTGDIGQCAVVPEAFDGCNCHALIIASLRTKVVEPEFLSFYFQSQLGKQELLSFQTGVTLAHLNSTRIGAARVILPSIPEQEALICFLEKKKKMVKQMIELKQSLIGKLEEYKKTLVYECVTGKRKA
jgi:type I restriction enzyme S subunit